jgi:hypothetical protein
MIARTIGFVALLLPSLALAETDFWISHDKINVNFGTFITEFDAEGRAMSDAGRGTKIDFEASKTRSRWRDSIPAFEFQRDIRCNLATLISAAMAIM